MAVRARFPYGNTEIEAECFECKAVYTLVSHPGGAVEFKPKMTLVGCPSEGCSERAGLWLSQRHRTGRTRSRRGGGLIWTRLRAAGRPH